MTGLEPVHTNVYWTLNPTRLPIPPHPCKIYSKKRITRKNKKSKKYRIKKRKSTNKRRRENKTIKKNNEEIIYKIMPKQIKTTKNLRRPKKKKTFHAIIKNFGLDGA